jgi:hypothetical protein
MREFVVAIVLVAVIAFVFFQLYPDKLVVVMSLFGF